jgi:hypothetical protein
MSGRPTHSGDFEAASRCAATRDGSLLAYPICVRGCSYARLTASIPAEEDWEGRGMRPRR